MAWVTDCRPKLLISRRLYPVRRRRAPCGFARPQLCDGSAAVQFSVSVISSARRRFTRMDVPSIVSWAGSCKLRSLEAFGQSSGLSSSHVGRMSERGAPGKAWGASKSGKFERLAAPPGGAPRLTNADMTRTDH